MYTIGQFSKKTGVTIRTLRFYDEKELLKPSYLSTSGRRYYNDQDLIILQNILTFKYLGYSLDHIRDMLNSRHCNLHQSLLRQKEEMLFKKEQLEKTIATLEHAIALSEKQESIHTDIFLLLIHGLIKEEEQKQYLKKMLPETFVNDLYNFTREELLEQNKQFMEYAVKLREAYHQQLPDEEVFAIVNNMFALVPEHLMNRAIESASEIEEHLEFDDSLFMTPFTKEEEEWLGGIFVKMSLLNKEEKHEGT